MLYRILILLLTTTSASVIYMFTMETAYACDSEEDVLLTSAASTADCHYDGDEAVSLSQSGDGHVYTLRISCGAFSDDINRCKQLSTCGTNPLRHLYELLRDGTPIGEVCLDADQASHFGEITPGLVLREFKNLDWPSAELVIQPRDNRTLVNYKTLFYTTLAEPATQTITLLGRKVLIEATPTTYIWHSDQGAEIWETADPSRPIEKGDDPADLNHYIYESKGTARPSVDVVYGGRFRIDGGAWQDIPDTLTLAGEPVDLTIREATPVLTGGDY